MKAKAAFYFLILCRQLLSLERYRRKKVSKLRSIAELRAFYGTCENKNLRFLRVLCAWTRDRQPAVLVRPSTPFPTISTLVLSGKDFRISVFRNICNFQDKIPNEFFLNERTFYPGPTLLRCCS